MAHTIENALLVKLADTLAKLANSDAQTAAASNIVSAIISEVFAKTNGNDAEFSFYFGNGLLGKKNDVGEIRRVCDARIAKLAKERRTKAAQTLRNRLSEARKLRAEYQGMPSKNETVQTALKRYAGAAAKKETTANTTPKESAKVSIADDASLDDLADALSIWVAKHGAASSGLAAKLADFLPVTVKRTRRQA